ncbi:hypothetical protein [Marinobacter zhejiangensis]|uniref:Transmembrane protein n=1 Tax=Marinobacter zhejiangensis TaxID=488535 RepID=A0A1I4LZ43_9GAMM|nr:hypothetical protein [Marinobacter zhejiangensis]SFL96438.1 hypothetical protein SAMN04487963_0765 [Marinobacter zhejiangensis]
MRLSNKKSLILFFLASLFMISGAVYAACDVTAWQNCNASCLGSSDVGACQQRCNSLISECSYIPQ